MEKIITIILLLSCICINPEFISANGTSYFEDTVFPSGHVLPLEERVVSIVSEKLFIEIEQNQTKKPFNTENPVIQANIRVVYEMLNQTEEDLTVPIAFPQPGVSNHWKVILDGENVPLTGTVSIKTKELTGENQHKEWIHPRIGEKYTFGGYDVMSESTSMDSKTFDVTLKARQTHTLSIEYKTLLGQDERESLHPVYRLDYLLHPASYWSDFKNLFIQVDVPSKSRVHMNLPLDKESRHTYVGEFDELPEENLVLFISPSSGLLIDFFNSRGGALLFFVVLLPVFYLILRFTNKTLLNRKKWFSLILLGVFIFASFDILSHKIMGYPITFVQFILFAMYVLILSLLWTRNVKNPEEY